MTLSELEEGVGNVLSRKLLSRIVDKLIADDMLTKDNRMYRNNGSTRISMNVTATDKFKAFVESCDGFVIMHTDSLSGFIGFSKYRLSTCRTCILKEWFIYSMYDRFKEPVYVSKRAFRNRFNDDEKSWPNSIIEMKNNGSLEAESGYQYTASLPKKVSVGIDKLLSGYTISEWYGLQSPNTKFETTEFYVTLSNKAKLSCLYNNEFLAAVMSECYSAGEQLYYVRFKEIMHLDFDNKMEIASSEIFINERIVEFLKCYKADAKTLLENTHAPANACTKAMYAEEFNF